MEEGSGFKSEDALSLTNEASGIMLSTSCDVNAFDSLDPCLSEAFMRNPEGGCVAFLGSSRYGFGNPDQTSLLDPSFQYSASFMKYLFTASSGVRGNSFATVAALAKSDFTHNGSSGGIYLYLLYALNPMGDPELPIFTRDPSVFDNVRMYRMGNTLTVNTGGVSNCRICLTSDDLSDGYHKVIENVSYCTFEDIPGAFQVTITARDFIPYRYRSGSATGMENNLNSFIRIFPNPVSEDLRVDVDFQEGDLYLYDIRGRLMQEKKLFFGSNKVSMSAYPEGTYLLKFMSDRSTGWAKVLKEP